ncbi:hypothetical protein CLOM_g4480, partial [Closterium sp. NIES-68]
LANTCASRRLIRTVSRGDGFYRRQPTLRLFRAVSHRIFAEWRYFAPVRADQLRAVSAAPPPTPFSARQARAAENEVPRPRLSPRDHRVSGICAGIPGGAAGRAAGRSAAGGDGVRAGYSGESRAGIRFPGMRRGGAGRPRHGADPGRPCPPSGNIIIERIEGDNGRLGLDPTTNCIGIAARATMELLGLYGPDGKGSGTGSESKSDLPVIGLTLNKGLPLGSGLGSSAASAAAAAVAVNALFGSPLSKAQLVLAGLQSEAAVSGYHADNVAPALMGGFVLVRSYRPLHLIPLAFGGGSGDGAKKLFFVVVTPAFEAPTKEMRAALPKEITMASHVANSSQAAALIHAINTADPRLLGAALASDTIVEPRRSPLIPGMSAVKVAAKAAGAYGCTISGAGPTAVAVVDSEEVGRAVGAAMVEAFREQGKLQAKATVAALDAVGGRVV